MGQKNKRDGADSAQRWATVADKSVASVCLVGVEEIVGVHGPALVVQQPEAAGLRAAPQVGYVTLEWEPGPLPLHTRHQLTQPVTITCQSFRRQ
jgi:hypothetical protein